MVGENGPRYKFGMQILSCSTMSETATLFWCVVKQYLSLEEKAEINF